MSLENSYKDALAEFQRKTINKINRANNLLNSIRCAAWELGLEYNVDDLPTEAEAVPKVVTFENVEECWDDCSSFDDEPWLDSECEYWDDSGC